MSYTASGQYFFGSVGILTTQLIKMKLGWYRGVYLARSPAVFPLEEV